MRKRFPTTLQILPVLAEVSVLFYAWTIVLFLYKLPSWLYYLHIIEIGGILARALFVNFIESIAFLLLLVILSAVLPPRFFRDEFIVRGSIASLVVIGSMMLFIYCQGKNYEIVDYEVIWVAITLILVLVSSAFSTRVAFIRQGIISISDRLVVFLYLLLPLSIISIIYILIQTLKSPV
jgi:hypothetical protein